MTLPVITSPFDVYVDLAGLTLNGGDVYIGIAGMDPQTNPQAVWWDAAATIAATQPLDTLGGYIMHNGTPARAYTAATYSMRVRDRAGVQVFYEPNAFTPQITLTDLTFTQAGTGAVNRTALSKMREVFSVADFGATGDGTTDDTVNLQKAEDAALAAGAELWFPPGTYMLGALLVKRSVTWRGPGGRKATLKARAVSFASGLMIFGSALGDFEIEGLAFDSSLMTAPSLRASLALQVSARFSVHHCEFINFPDVGLSMDGCNNFWVEDNYLSILLAKSTQNQAIQISTSAGACKNGIIARNTLIGSGIDGSGQFLRFSDNYIDGFKFGGGIVSEVDAFTSDWIIEGNVCINGTGVDSNTTACLGIENWATRSIIRGNICALNAGVGIDNGGPQCVISDNMCFNNGQNNVGAGLVSQSGIRSRYFSAGVNGSHSVITGNRCFDTQSPKTQTYGYEDQATVGTSLLNITFSGNNFNDNLTAPISILGAGHDMRWPQMMVRVAGTIGAVAAGAVTALATASVPGVKVGDIVTMSWFGDLTGGTSGLLILAGCVTADNTVKWQAHNPTASSINGGGAGTVMIVAQKPLNYLAY